jgi:hypothetical protein
MMLFFISNIKYKDIMLFFLLGHILLLLLLLLLVYFFVYNATKNRIYNL